MAMLKLRFYRFVCLMVLINIVFLFASQSCSDSSNGVEEQDAVVDAEPHVDADLSMFDHPARVLSVIDGDTIRVSFHGEITTIRFIGVDAPEMTPEPEPYGPEAENYVRHHAPVLSWIGLEFDDDVCAGAIRPEHCNDIYGRLLAYIRTSKGDDLGLMLLAVGLARVYTYGDFGRKDEYIEMENYARNLGVGIWSR